VKPVCVVGAGPAGLSAAVALQRRGIPFRVLDAGRRPGGIWDFEREDTPMYASAHFISSKTLSGFPDYPMPESYADYPRHDRIQDYIVAYARHHDLERQVTFGATVTSARPVDEDDTAWEVAWRTADGGTETEIFSALVLATGVTWHPRLPRIPGAEVGPAGPDRPEVRHSKTYRSPEEFRGRRVVIVGGGNSGVDIACDAARSADRALLSLRRGYHFVPKYVFGKPADVFARTGPHLPVWLEQRIFGFLIGRVLVGDLTRYGLPKPDHPILSSHPIMNTQVLHHLGHGDLLAKPDLTRIEGREAVFEDGSREEVDLVLLATGYRRAFPFLEIPAFGQLEPDDREVAPDDLFLTLLHRRHPTLAFMGIFETDGAAYDLFARQAETVAGTLEALQGRGADEIRETIADDTPDQRGGSRYIDSTRHDFYVTGRAYRRALRAFSRRLEASTLAGLTT
jgi:thioredoxin reductase